MKTTPDVKLGVFSIEGHIFQMKLGTILEELPGVASIEECIHKTEVKTTPEVKPRVSTIEEHISKMDLGIIPEELLGVASIKD